MKDITCEMSIFLFRYNDKKTLSIPSIFRNRFVQVQYMSKLYVLFWL